jgi:hypothetical protein
MENKTYEYTCREAEETHEAKYLESWPSTTSAWAGWSRFDIPVDRYGGVHSLLVCTSSILGSPTCHQASKQENTYRTKYQKADRAITLCTLWKKPRRRELQGIYMVGRGTCTVKDEKKDKRQR